MAEYLLHDPTAAQHEAKGLNNSLQGNQNMARVQYDAALAALHMSITPAPSSADYAAQRGSVLRNYGFTYVRDGILSGAEASFQDGFSVIQDAVAQTALFAAGAKPRNFQRPQEDLPHQTHKNARRELFSAHAASLGLLARAATAAEVTLDSSTEQTQEYRAHYGTAHDFARLGTNGYFRVSNAMNGARDERIAGRNIHAGVWVARAAFGIAWSVKNDRSNLKNAARTFFGRIPQLRSREVARTSIANRP